MHTSSSNLALLRDSDNETLAASIIALIVVPRPRFRSACVFTLSARTAWRAAPLHGPFFTAKSAVSYVNAITIFI